MRSGTLLPFVGLAAGLVLSASPPRAHGQEQAKFEKIKFETFDSVELQGSYWASTKGKKAPCAILLHKFGGKSHEDGWDDLAEGLQKLGFAVLSFDFRGHGDSTNVGDDFWKNPINQRFIRNYKPGSLKQPTSISQGDFNSMYIPYLVNDIAAARAFLERKNDNGECNVGNTVLIGAEEGATLGLLWLTFETYRHQVIFPPGRPSSKPESKDIAACVWLSMNKTMGKNLLC